MVDMGVGQQHEIDTADVEAEVEGMQVFGSGLAAALKHSAVDQKTDVTRFDQRTRTCHFASRTMKTDTHFKLLFNRPSMNLGKTDCNADPAWCGRDDGVKQLPIRYAYIGRG